MSGRHADVEDCQIGLALANEPHQRGSVTGLADDFVSPLLEQARQSLPHQHVVLSDDDPWAGLILLGHREIMPQSRPSSPSPPPRGI